MVFYPQYKQGQIFANPEGQIANRYSRTAAQRHAVQPHAERAKRAERVGWSGSGELLILLEEPFILVVGSNPKPRYRIPFQQSKCPVSQTNAH